MNHHRSVRGLLLAMTLMLAAAASAMAQGKVEVVGGDSYNWGKVAPGRLKATIVVRNAGTGPLKISHVQPSCGCTSSPIDRNLLQPGETGSISVTLDAKRVGPVDKLLTLHSDAPGDPEHRIHLIGEVQSPEPDAQVSINGRGK